MTLDKIGTRLSVIVVFLLAFGYYFPAWLIAIVANSYLIIHNHKIGEYPQRNMFMAFLVFAIIGLWRAS